MPDAKLTIYCDAVVNSMSLAQMQVRQALALIADAAKFKGDPEPMQLLALRRYLRIGGKKLEANWSWTEAEAATGAQREPGKTLYAQAAIVQSKFATQNPGFTLSISPIRSLERQVTLWNNNDTTHTAGARLVSHMRKELQKPAYPTVPSGAGTAKFSSALRTAMVAPEPTNAAPGTSDHGRGTAVDFVVVRNGAIVANTLTSHIGPIWNQAGWGAKLAAACKGTRLVGPLKVPNEPWHWVLGK